jgi:hypothetical protein
LKASQLSSRLRYSEEPMCPSDISRGNTEVEKDGRSCHPERSASQDDTQIAFRPDGSR